MELFLAKNVVIPRTADVRRFICEGKEDMSIGTILLIILVLILLGGLGGIGGSPFYGTGYYGGGGLGLVIVILFILVLYGQDLTRHRAGRPRRLSTRTASWRIRAAALFRRWQRAVFATSIQTGRIKPSDPQDFEILRRAVRGIFAEADLLQTGEERFARCGRISMLGIIVPGTIAHHIVSTVEQLAPKKKRR